ncbi:hypothetical protein H0R92_13210 [Treponema sp. OMZ 840]|uniref:hypothetical protein n=1 Tax=Treponema sp. OMZ 840 TaxID=244313 RepID=UPI003D8C3499
MSILRILCFYADIQYMGSLAAFSVIVRVISDFRLIIACITVLIYINFIFYVARYKKKPRIQRKRFIQVKAAAEQKNTASGEVGDTEEVNDASDSGNAGGIRDE